MRLDKFLSEAGIGTRSQVKAYIKKGQVTVNGQAVKKPEQKIDADQDVIRYNGLEIRYTAFVYIMLNKPKGCVSATEDRREQTVLDLLKDIKRKDLFPVGRLDKDTEGLLLITNDGALAHRLLSPKKHVDKTYYAVIDGLVTKEDIATFKAGLDIGDDKPAMPAGLIVLKAGAQSEVEVTVQEGRFHQIKRMFEAVGKRVVYLKRIRMGSLRLDASLLPGQYRNLSEEEVDRIRRIQC